MTSIEELYEEHLKKEPKEYKFYNKELDIKIPVDAWFSWKVEKDNLELIKEIPREKRIEAMNLIKKGKTCGEVARELNVKVDAVFYLIHYNIEKN